MTTFYPAKAIFGSTKSLKRTPVQFQGPVFVP
jgi:hypothetical protein